MLGKNDYVIYIEGKTQTKLGKVFRVDIRKFLRNIIFIISKKIN